MRVAGGTSRPNEFFTPFSSVGRAPHPPPIYPSHSTHTPCGDGDPDISAYFDSLPHSVVPQVYPEHTEGGRDLFTTAHSYSSVAPFVPLSDLVASGAARNIRIVPYWGIVNGTNIINDEAHTCPDGVTLCPDMHSYPSYNSDGTSRLGDGTLYFQCNAALVAASSNSDSYVQLVSGQKGSVPCTSAMAVDPYNPAYSPLYRLLVNRTAMAAAYWSSALLVRPALDNITVNPALLPSFGVSGPLSIPNADLVLLMTTRPSPNRPVAGYASCLQRDQYGRCTVGQFNWVPELVSVADADSVDTMTNVLHTALHEIVHVLGGMGPGSFPTGTAFINELGEPKAASEVFLVQPDPAYGGTKDVTYIITPKVVNITRTAFNCDSIPGFPLEDLTLGAGSHWEARLAGPELMSYGTGSGLVFVSDLTLAFLEDTNQYVANYSKAGQLVASSKATSANTLTTLSFLTNNALTNDSYNSLPPPLSNGFLRWGAGAGCEWAMGNPAAWNGSYVCTKNNQYGCTQDNRMTAVCVITNAFTQESTCGSKGSMAATGGSAVCDYTVPTANVPPIMRWFNNSQLATDATGLTSASASSTGGYSNALDYRPIFAGYWSCLDATPPNSPGQTGEQGFNDGTNLNASITANYDLKVSGGQTRCPDCRCFVSSLQNYANKLVKVTQLTGMCYRFNCYHSDYLQVGITSAALSSYEWYPCPAGGGKVYVPGYAGHLSCPDPTTFCALESVSGVKYPESNYLKVVIFWGILLGLFLLFVISWILPCCRNPQVRCLKRCCGARQFDTAFVQMRKSDGVWEVVFVPPDAMETAPRISWVLTIITSIGFLLGLALLGLGIYTMFIVSNVDISVASLGCAILIVVVSLTGCVASRRKNSGEEGPSCCLLLFTFEDLFLVIIVAWAAIYLIVLSHMKEYVTAHWDTISSMLPSSVIGTGNKASQLANAQAFLQANQTAAGAIALTLCLMLLVSLAISCYLVRFRIIAAMSLAITAHLSIGLGVIITACGVWMYTSNSIVVPDMPRAVGTFIAIGVLFLVVGIVQEIAIFRKNRFLLVVITVVSVLFSALMWFAVWVFVDQAARVEAWVLSLPDSTLAFIGTALGGRSITQASLSNDMQDYMQNMAVASGILALMELYIAICAISYLRNVGFERQLKDVQEGRLPNGVQLRSMGVSGRLEGVPLPDVEQQNMYGGGGGLYMGPSVVKSGGPRSSHAPRMV